MSSQINFFVTDGDIAAIRRDIHSRSDVVFLISDSASRRLVEWPQSTDRILVSQNLRFYIVRGEEIPRIEIEERKKANGDIVFAPKFEFSPMIEFLMSHMGRNFIRAGRLYRIDKSWRADGTQFIQDEVWTSWAKMIFRLFKRHLWRVEGTPYFAGQEALSLRSSEFLFQQIDDPANLLCD